MTPRTIKLLLAMVIGAVLCCSVAIINGAPVFYPDSIGYLVDGQELIRLTTPSSGRPIFYGLAIWFLHWERTTWPIVFVQGLIVTHLIWLALRVQGYAPSISDLLGVIAALVIITPLSWYVSEVLPDIFTGVLLLSLFLLGFAADRLNLAETIYIVLLAAGSAAFHLAHLPIALAIPAVVWIAYLTRRNWRPAIRPALMTAPIVLAVAASLTYSWVEYRSISFTTEKGPPWLMAKLLADGTAKAYLRATCGREHYVICGKLDGLPDTPDGILWGPKRLAGTPEERIKMHAEEGRIFLGTIRMLPGQVVDNVLANTMEQLVTPGFSTEFTPAHGVQIMQDAPYAGREYRQSREAKGWLSDNNLSSMNWFHAGVALVGLVCSVWLAMRCFQLGNARPLLLLATTVFGLLVNACVTGSLSEIHGRYEGRAIWLLPFCAVLSGWVLVRTRRPA